MRLRYLLARLKDKDVRSSLFFKVEPYIVFPLLFFFIPMLVSLFSRDYVIGAFAFCFVLSIVYSYFRYKRSEKSSDRMAVTKNWDRFKQDIMETVNNNLYRTLEDRVKIGTCMGFGYYVENHANVLKKTLLELILDKKIDRKKLIGDMLHEEHFEIVRWLTRVEHNLKIFERK